MNIAIIVFKFVVFSIFGYFINKFIYKIRKLSNYKFFYGIISPGYGVFSLIGIYSPNKNIFGLFILGVIFAIILNFIFNLIDNNYFYQIDFWNWGILNILNVLIINVLLDRLIVMIPNFLIVSFSFLSFILVLVDISLSFRKNF